MTNHPPDTMDLSDEHLGTYEGFTIRSTYLTEPYDGVLAVKQIVATTERIRISAKTTEGAKSAVEGLTSPRTLRSVEHLN